MATPSQRKIDSSDYFSKYAVLIRNAALLESNGTVIYVHANGLEIFFFTDWLHYYCLRRYL